MRKGKRLPAWPAAAAFVALFAVYTSATTLLPADLGELSREARVIARGQIVAVEGRVSDDRRAIETLVTLAPERYLKGSLGPLVQFRVPGGQVGRVRRIMVGAPDFSVGQHVIVFLGARPPGLPYVLGLSQGVYRVVSDGTTWRVTQPAIVASGAPGPIVRGDVARRPLPLADFEREVQALAEEPR